VTYLDLLPEHRRGGYLRRLRARIALLSVLLSLVLVFDAIVLLSFDAGLNEIFNTTLAVISESPKDRAAVLAQREANLASIALDSFRASGDAVAGIAAAAPAGVRLDLIELETGAGKLVAAGVAASVADVVRFREELEASGRFRPIETVFRDLRSDGSVRFLLEAEAELTTI
jgi:hypothetical protein